MIEEKTKIRIPKRIIFVKGIRFDTSPDSRKVEIIERKGDIRMNIARRPEDVKNEFVCKRQMFVEEYCTDMH